MDSPGQKRRLLPSGEVSAGTSVPGLIKTVKKGDRFRQGQAGEGLGFRIKALTEP